MYCLFCLLITIFFLKDGEAHVLAEKNGFVLRFGGLYTSNRFLPFLLIHQVNHKHCLSTEGTAWNYLRYLDESISGHNLFCLDPFVPS